jgi:hypothetical protein
LICVNDGATRSTLKGKRIRIEGITMNIDTPVPRASSRLVARMMLLARLIEHIGPHEPRRLLLERILRQVLLFSRMSERLGIAAPESPLMRALYREAELGCLECTVWNRCRNWLDGRAPDDDYSNFCPNESLFSTLPRQSNVMRPYAPE